MTTNIIHEYHDQLLDAEELAGLQIGEYGYKYRIIDNLILPPYITPKRYELSRTLKTREGDVCFTSYPKSGSTWLSYVLLLLIHKGQEPTDKTLRDSSMELLVLFLRDYSST